MKRLSRLVVTAAIFVGLATVAAAATSPSVLNKLELQKLVAAETPIANLRLAAHFDGLAEQYSAEAATYRNLAVTYKANANRSATVTAADSCARRAARATTWADRARALARYHFDLALGRQAVLPVGATALHSGYGAPEPTTDQLHRLALTARTRADHLALREYYSTVARKKSAEADSYFAMAGAFHAGVRNGSYDPAGSYDRLGRLARKAAREATQAADRHAVFANIG
jgi:hypothetical protein